MYFRNFILTTFVLRLGIATSSLFQFETEPSYIPDLEPRADTLPFNKIVAFGDDFTDNGQGSYAHGITGDPITGSGIHMWGANTFTDGKVAVSYLAQRLKIPLVYDYAFGSSGGAGVIGSICDNSIIPKKKWDSHALLDGKLVPDALQQVKNYTSTGAFTNDIGNTLHFFWTGNNDMIASLGWTGRFTLCIVDTLCVPGQRKFVDQLITCFESGLTSLVDAGAKHILVPNIYPRNLSPWTTMWISSLLGMIANFGGVIDLFNTKLQDSINKINKQRGTNIMYYDVNAFIQKTLNDNSLVQGAGYIDTCVDGCTKKNPTGISNWDLYWNYTVVHHKPDLFYWMTEIMPSTTVHNFIAQDMAKFIRAK